MPWQANRHHGFAQAVNGLGDGRLWTAFQGAPLARHRDGWRQGQREGWMPRLRTHLQAAVYVGSLQRGERVMALMPARWQRVPMHALRATQTTAPWRPVIGMHPAPVGAQAGQACVRAGWCAVAR